MRREAEELERQKELKRQRQEQEKLRQQQIARERKAAERREKQRSSTQFALSLEGTATVDTPPEVRRFVTRPLAALRLADNLSNPD